MFEMWNNVAPKLEQMQQQSQVQQPHTSSGSIKGISCMYFLFHFILFSFIVIKLKISMGIVAFGDTWWVPCRIRHVDGDGFIFERFIELNGALL